MCRRREERARALARPSAKGRGTHERYAERLGVQCERVDRLEVFERDGWICQICGAAVRRDGAPFLPDSAEIDHRVPMARGGGHTWANCQCACRRCNGKKGARLHFEPEKELGIGNG